MRNSNSPKNKLQLRLLFTCFLLLTSGVGLSQIRLPAIISDNMVLQQNEQVVIWGWTAEPAENIAVWGSWNMDTVYTRADKGRWRVTLETPDKGGPYKVTVRGNETVSIDNVLIGEVWLASGQSNMEMTIGPNYGLNGILDYKEEIAAGDTPEIRVFTVEKRIADFPQENLLGKWVVASPKTLSDFSAVAYYFGKNLHQGLKVPVGMITSSWSGTNAESWIPKDVIHKDPHHKAGQERAVEYPTRPSKAGEAYNAMIYPLIPYKIKGAIFYQGESNRYDGKNYFRLFSDLIRSWRLDRKEEFPFYYTQIAPFDYGEDQAVLIREAQLKALKLPHTGMAVTGDIGNLRDIHPREKKEVGRRLALWALSETYKLPNLVFSGPVYRSMSVEKNRVRLKFDHAREGLQTKGDELKHFEIAGSNREFVRATAVIEGNTVVVSHRNIKNPVAVRYAFSDVAESVLYNKAGLPASAFRTDDWDLGNEEN